MEDDDRIAIVEEDLNSMFKMSLMANISGDTTRGKFLGAAGKAASTVAEAGALAGVALSKSLYKPFLLLKR